MFDRITFNPQIMWGRACIRGMRIPVSVIVVPAAGSPAVGSDMFIDIKRVTRSQVAAGSVLTII
jgi:uncharacterized protein (DUF433 family)